MKDRNLIIQFNLETFKRLTKTQQEALDLIGRRRKTKVIIGKDISARTFNKLEKMGLAMRYGDNYAMLTYRGERVWTAVHPNSKYRSY